MEPLFIKRITVANKVNISMAAHLLEKNAINHSIEIINWENFPYQPKVQFRIAHSDNQLWLLFYVNEKNILARETRTNGEVYKDSCVEFFISFDGENYYNFEFNGIGTTHLAYGPGRDNRKFVPVETVEKIETKSTLGTHPFEEKSGNFEWEMMIRIPIECFAYSDIGSFGGKEATGNFYKCGDETSDPHFVTWQPVKTEQPDYHRPEYFGKIVFE